MKKLIFIIILLAGCENRERLNPLDPENEYTQGAPTGLWLLSHRDSVQINWNGFDVDHMAGYEIYRGEGDLELIDVITADQTTYVDTGVEYYQEYTYAIRAKTEFSQSNLSQEKKVIPGPWNAVVADMYNFHIRNISFDGRTITQEKRFNSPRAMVTDPNSNQMYVADYFDQKIYGLNRSFTIQSTIELPSNPIAMDVGMGKFFVLLEDSTIRSFDISGPEDVSHRLEFDPNLSSEIAYDTKTEKIYVSLNKHNRVIVLDANTLDQEGKKEYEFQNPGPIEPNYVQGGVFVATESGIVNIDISGGVNKYLADLFIHDISTHPDRSELYYVGSKERAVGWEVGYINIKSGERVQILGNEYSRLYNIQMIPADGEHDGFVVQQAFPGKLMRFNKSGEKWAEIDGFNSRLDFILD